MKRVFIALPISSEVEKELLNIQDKIKEKNQEAFIKWIESGNFHLTLEFLGEINDSDVLRAKDVLEMVVGNYPVINFSLGRILGFPNEHHPNVLAIEAFDADQVGHSLREDIHKQLKSMNLADNGRPWKPHLTLGRVKNHVRFNEPDKIEASKISWTVNQVVLYESHLTKEGPLYSSLAKYRLDQK